MVRIWHEPGRSRRSRNVLPLADLDASRAFGMKTHLTSLAALVLLVVNTSHAQVVKQEPFEGKMVPGSIILVDDGSCGKGKIKQVTGGETDAMNPRPRIRKCIPKNAK